MLFSQNVVFLNSGIGYLNHRMAMPEIAVFLLNQ